MHKESFTSAVAECEEVAKTRGHMLGRWQPLGPSLHPAICKLCREIAWVMQASDTEHWLIGGEALRKDCLRAEN